MYLAMQIITWCPTSKIILLSDFYLHPSTIEKLKTVKFQCAYHLLQRSIRNQSDWKHQTAIDHQHPPSHSFFLPAADTEVSAAVPPDYRAALFLFLWINHRHHCQLFSVCFFVNFLPQKQSL